MHKNVWTPELIINPPELINTNFSLEHKVLEAGKLDTAPRYWKSATDSYDVVVHSDVNGQELTPEKTATSEVL